MLRLSRHPVNPLNQHCCPTGRHRSSEYERFAQLPKHALVL